jgi:hypothetical protein
VAFDLVDSRDDTGAVDKSLEVLNSVVGDTDRASLALGELGHGLPGINDGNIVIDDHITTINSAVGDEREVRLALLECDRPVDKIKLNL